MGGLFLHYIAELSFESCVKTQLVLTLIPTATIAVSGMPIFTHATLI